MIIIIYKDAIGYEVSSSSAKSSPKGLAISSMPSAGDIKLTWVPLQTIRPNRLVWSVNLNGSFGSVQKNSSVSTNLLVGIRIFGSISHLVWIRYNHLGLDCLTYRTLLILHQPHARPACSRHRISETDVVGEAEQSSSLLELMIRTYRKLRTVPGT